MHENIDAWKKENHFFGNICNSLEKIYRIDPVYRLVITTYITFLNVAKKINIKFS